MSKYCTKCGKELKKEDIFCGYCGNQMIEETEDGEKVVTVSKTNGLAVAGFVVSLASLLINFWGITSVVGIILSAVALSQIKKTNESGKGFALAGLIIGIIGIIIMFVAFLFLVILSFAM